jgi:hypothetical protein
MEERKMEENKFWHRQWITFAVMFTVFCGSVTYCSDRSSQRTEHLRAAAPTVKTCVEHSREDRVTVTKGASE